MYQETIGGKIAKETLTQSISHGAVFCARIGETVWKRGTYINHRTGEIGFIHYILGGRPGTKWNKFYWRLSNSIQSPLPRAIP